MDHVTVYKWVVQTETKTETNEQVNEAKELRH